MKRKQLRKQTRNEASRAARGRAGTERPSTGPRSGVGRMVGRLESRIGFGHHVGRIRGHHGGHRRSAAWGHRLGRSFALRERSLNGVNASSLASGLGLTSRPRDTQEFTGTCLHARSQTSTLADSHHDSTHPSVELSMFVDEEAQLLMILKMRHPTKHSDVPKPSQAAGCSRSHVAVFSFASPVRSSIEALATIE